MDGAPKAGGGGGKAVLPVSPAGNDANAGAERAARQAPLPEDAAADAPAAAASGGEEEEDDEQVERFYALLDSIRVMRGAYGAGTGADDGGASGKRRRAAEPPWRPAFRPEDFEELALPDVVRRRRAARQEDAAPAGGGRQGGRRAGVRLDGQKEHLIDVLAT